MDQLAAVFDPLLPALEVFKGYYFGINMEPLLSMVPKDLRVQGTEVCYPRPPAPQRTRNAPRRKGQIRGWPPYPQRPPCPRSTAYAVENR